MKKGGSCGGGESSLGYLFGSDNKQKNAVAPPSPSTCRPPYGIDTDDDYKLPEKSPPSEHKSTVSNNYPRVQGQNSGNFLTGRPTTKVKCAPGGDSSLGYLFEDTF